MLVQSFLTLKFKYVLVKTVELTLSKLFEFDRFFTPIKEMNNLFYSKDTQKRNE